MAQAGIGSFYTEIRSFDCLLELEETSSHRKN